MRAQFVLVLTSAAFGLSAVAGPAGAQAPPNDTFEQATVILSQPFSQTLDTSQATTDSTDAEALAACGLSVPVAATVWYRYTPSADQSLLISTSGSSYATGVAVLTGPPGNLFAVTCFPVLGTFSATAGRTYHIGLADVSGGSGGTLNVSIDAPGVELTIDRFGRFNAETGVGAVTGRLTCPSGSSGTVSLSLSQRRGRRTASGFGFTDVTCNGAAQQWSVSVTPVDGEFKGGRADVAADAVVCLRVGCIADHADRRIILRR
jgi:Family of unknown function (DUF6299)